MNFKFDIHIKINVWNAVCDPICEPQICDSFSATESLFDSCCSKKSEGFTWHSASTLTTFLLCRLASLLVSTIFMGGMRKYKMPPAISIPPHTRMGTEVVPVAARIIPAMENMY